MAFSDRVVTLIANPANPCLTPQIAEECRNVLESSGVYFLADGIACDLPIPTNTQKIKIKLEETLSQYPIDFVVQHADQRRKKALLADMDSTLIQQECIDELAIEAGFGERVSKITSRAMRGELEFDSALRERVALLKGQPASIIKKVLETRIDLMPGAIELLATMKENGAYCALVSGGFTQFTSSIAKTLGFDEHRANSLEVTDGVLTGNVIPPILGKQAKVDALQNVAANRNLNPDEIMAVGDGANDLGMLKLAGSGIALHAKPIVAEQAKFCIDHGDLTALLYIQGYRKSDFVTP